MKQSKRLWRTLLFLVLLAALCGSFAFPVVNVPVRAAPMSANALDVVINEIAWAGTQADGNDEWIELYNPGTVDLSLTGWTLKATDGTPNITTLSGVIPAGGFYLLERTDNTTVSDVVADLTYSGAMSNTGETFELRDSTNTLIDTANQSGGTWPAGSAGTNPYSMERIDILTDTPSAWATNNGAVRNGLDANSNPINGTAKQKNSATLALTATVTPTITNTPTITSTAASPRSVIINEVAWSGTTASNTHEWFELYNNTGATINLNGWQLESEDGIPTINLSGIIAAGDYFVAARSATTFNDLTVDLTYSSNPFQNNPDEILYLIDPNGNQVDTANLDGGAWDAGLGSPTYASMERRGTSADSPTAWATYGGTVPIAHDRQGNDIKGTPGQANWINTVVPTATSTQTNTPAPVARHSVIINEIAWAGTKADAEDEWIELRNTTNSPIDLTNWILKSDDNTPYILLTGYSIPAQGLLLLARRAGTFNDVTPNLVYGENASSLVNGGEVLRLKNSPTAATDVDTANLYTGYGFTKWAAGSGSPNYVTMERASFAINSPAEWFTFAGTPIAHDRSNNLVNGTPGKPNWAVSVTPTPSRVPTVIVVRTPTRVFTPLPPPPLVVINEFVPRPGHDWNLDGVVNVEDEYVELLNHGVVDVNLGGYSLDDEVNIGSAPYRLPAVVVRPGERIVFYGSETGLLLGDGGDGVRLLKPNGQLMDAYNYFIVGYPDQSHCRLPDNGGADDWNKNCFPTPGLQNSLGGIISPPRGGVVDLFCPIADTLPDEFAWAECEPYGHNIWRAAFWDRTGWYDEKYLPETNGKWPVFAD